MTFNAWLAGGLIDDGRTVAVDASGKPDTLRLP